MAYVKTNWVDNTTPIDKDNLNKIEKGIYDNSLVVDAVTNKLNPTDTETYKTAELTEGQITDVIGVNDIIIKGQTEQDGTPTPSAPVDVNVVSGSNVIKTSNKNLLSLPNRTYSYNNVTVIVNKGIITINGTPSSTPTLLQISLTQPIKLKQNDSIKINVNNLNGIGTSSNYVSFRLAGIVNGVSNDNITEAICTNTNANKTFTATNDTIINQVIIRGNANVTFNNFIIKPQIELGSTSTTYEPHQGKELPLDLPVENLSNMTNLFGNSEYYSINDSQLSVLGNDGRSWDNLGNNWGIQLSAGTYILSTSKGTTTQVQIQGKNSGQITRGAMTNGTKSFTLQQADIIGIKFLNISTYPKEIGTVQIEQGSKANAYTPYGTDPIELCKIGDYQDYFYKSGSKWYLHKEVEKKVLNGSEEWTLRSGSRFTVDIPSANGEFISTGLSNQYKFIANWDTHVTTNHSFIVRNGTWGVNKCRISLINTDYEDVTQFKADLATNNLIVYYQKISQLGGVTNTEITNTTLISQLEAIYNAPLYEQTNIIQTNNDLPMVLDITAYKDNINGIKAFIRK